MKGEDICDLMLSAVEHRFGPVERLPQTIEWLTDNGSCYVAGPTRSFARELGFEQRTTLLESPQSNGEINLHLVRPAKRLHRYPVNGKRRSLQDVSSALDRAAFLMKTDRPFTAEAVSRIARDSTAGKRHVRSSPLRRD
jgi:hypothetical protein